VSIFVIYKTSRNEEAMACIGPLGHMIKNINLYKLYSLLCDPFYPFLPVFHLMGAGMG